MMKAEDRIANPEEKFETSLTSIAWDLYLPQIKFAAEAMVLLPSYIWGWLPLRIPFSETCPNPFSTYQCSAIRVREVYEDAGWWPLHCLQVP